MTIWDRISNRMRDAIDQSGPGATAGGGRRPGDIDGTAPSLAERLGLLRISDEALLTELERRRRLRGKTPSRRPAGDDELDARREARRSRVRERPLAKAYAALEVAPTASRDEIERAYRMLLRQFHPDRHLGDAEQHQSALALAASLTDSYLAVLQRFER